MTSRSWLGLLALGLMASLFLTWPGSPWAGALAVAATGAVAVFVRLGQRGQALAALAGLGLSTMVLQSSVTAWRPWVSAALVAVILHGLFGSVPDPRAAWVRTAGLVAGFAGIAVLAWLWRPTRASLAGAEGQLVAVGLIGAAATGIVLWSTADVGEEFV